MQTIIVIEIENGVNVGIYKEKKRQKEITIVMMAHCCIDKHVFQVYLL